MTRDALINAADGYFSEHLDKLLYLVALCGIYNRERLVNNYDIGVPHKRVGIRHTLLF